MPVDQPLRDLVERVSEFHLSDRRMFREQRDMQRELDTGSVDTAVRARYLDAVRRYFSGFEAEARTHLHDVDRRLEALHQVQFNLGAERSVAARRIEIASGVLNALAAFTGENT